MFNIAYSYPLMHVVLPSFSAALVLSFCIINSFTMNLFDKLLASTIYTDALSF